MSLGQHVYERNLKHRRRLFALAALLGVAGMILVCRFDWRLGVGGFLLLWASAVEQEVRRRARLSDGGQP